MSILLPDDGEVLQLPPPKPGARPPRCHVFGEAIMVPAELSISGHDQKEKTCANCGAVRVTIFGAKPGEMRGWRRRSDGPQLTTGLAPPCEPPAGAP